MSKYKIINGTSYNEFTDEKIVDILENARLNRTRISVDYGNISTGRNFGYKSCDGYIGRSIGPIKVPLLIHNSRSSGGEAVLCNCIVREYAQVWVKKFYINTKIIMKKINTTLFKIIFFLFSFKILTEIFVYVRRRFFDNNKQY